MEEPACKPDPVHGVRTPPATISLARTANRPRAVPFTGTVRSTRQYRAGRPTACSTLLRVGVAEPRRSPGALVGSYPTVSPLPPRRAAAAVCSLLPCPRGRPRLAFASTLPYGVRTFLERFPARGRPAGSSVLEDSRCLNTRALGASGRRLRSPAGRAPYCAPCVRAHRRSGRTSPPTTTLHGAVARCVRS